MDDVVGLADWLTQGDFLIASITPRTGYVQGQDGTGGQGYRAAIKQGDRRAGVWAGTQGIPFFERRAGRKWLPLLLPGRSPADLIAGGRDDCLLSYHASRPQLVDHAGDHQKYNQGGGRRPTPAKET